MPSAAVARKAPVIHPIRPPVPGPYQQQKRQRIDEVELLLHRQRPGVQQGHRRGGRREIGILEVEEYVREQKRLGDQRPRKGLEFQRIQQQMRQDGGSCKHQDHGWRQPADAPSPECPQAEPAGITFAQDQAGDQIAGDDEKDVDADKAARHPGQAGMIRHDAKDGDCPQSVNLGPVAIMHRKDPVTLHRSPPPRPVSASAPPCHEPPGSASGMIFVF